MSHFTVLVATEAKPAEDVLAKAMAPFHEFECTGEDNEYVINVDKTAEARAAYEKHTVTRYKTPAGELVDPYRDEFYREPTAAEVAAHGPMMGSGCGGGICWESKDWGDGKGHRAKVHFLPSGYEEVRVPAAREESFADFIDGWYGFKRLVGKTTQPDLAKDHKYGWCRVDEHGEVIEAIKRTNPNKKWDWYAVGGRWMGYFKVRPGASDVSVGRPGAFDNKPEPGWADSLRKQDVDTEGMRDEAGKKAGERWDRIMAVVGDLGDFVPWPKVLDSNFGNIDMARGAYHAQRAVKALHGAKDSSLAFANLEDFACTRAEYVERARKQALTPFAFLRDSKWAERGHMGFWACVSDEKADWPDQFEALWNDVPADWFVTAVDCHI